MHAVLKVLVKCDKAKSINWTKPDGVLCSFSFFQIPLK